MIISTIPASNCTPQTIVIGRRGTYDTMQIAFDLSYLIENYGSGTAVLAIKRSQDESAYPAIVTQEDATLLWTVNETDTAYVGSGECQLMWYVDGGLAKTIIYPMVVMRDILSTAETPPDGYENWVEHLTDLGVETLRNAQNAAQSASDAETAKDDSVTAKEASEAAKEAAEEAQEKAEIAVSHYPVIINGYWNVWSVEAQTYVSTGIKAEGEDGYSPEVTITAITGGHRVTITDKDHPQGQSFDVMDGQGGGTSDYTSLTNKPQINGNTLEGDQTAEQLGLATPSDIPDDAGDIGYDATETYESGTVGGGLNNLSRQLSDLEDTVSTTQIINSASGAIASFDDGADDLPICKLVANIEPVQDLHGYENPWPGGGGKNLAQLIEDGTVPSISNGQLVPAAGCRTEFIKVTPSGTYTLSYSGTGISTIYYMIYASDKTYLRYGSLMNSPKTITLNNGDEYVMLRTTEGLSAFAWFQFEAGSATDYAPYSNICPISGHTGVEIRQTGANVWDEEWELGGLQGGTGNPFYTTDRIRSVNYCPCKPSTSYYGYFGTTSSALIVWWFDAEKHYINAIGGSNKVITSPANAAFFKISTYSGNYTTYLNDISINYPATDTEYHPYTGDQISVTFPSEAGTVYGGTLTINPDRTGTLVVDRVKVNLSFNLPTRQELDRWIVGAYLDNTLSTLIGKQWALSEEPLKNLFLVSNLPIIRESSLTSTDSCSVSFYGHISGVEVRPRFLVSDYTAEQAKAIADAMELVYPINPITYPLTESEISGILETLYGTNNILSSTGDTEVTYPADTKLYIDGKIAEAIAASNA